jgi:hypothetical protein
MAFLPLAWPVAWNPANGVDGHGARRGCCWQKPFSAEPGRLVYKMRCS